MSAFDHPAVPAEPVFALAALASDARFDAAAMQVLPAPREIVSLVRMQLVRATARSAAPPSHPRYCIHKRLEDDRVVPVGAGDTEHQRDAFAVGDEVALAAELAAVGGIRPRMRAPRGLGTLAPSKLTRLKSRRPALRNSASKSMCTRCHTPAACHSRSLRQQVMPLPKPSSCGRSSQGMPVRSTKRMPLSACSSSSRGLPALPERSTRGSSGLILFHSAALICLFLSCPMHRQTDQPGRAMTRFC